MDTPSYHFNGVSLYLAVAALFALAMVFFLLRRKRASGAMYLVFLEAAVVIWTVGAIFEYAADQVPLKIFWSQVAYIGTTTTPVLYFLFVMTYAKQARFKNPWVVGSLFVIPAITYLLAVTNGSHHLVWTQVTILPKTRLAIYGHGAWFWFFVAYSYLMLTGGCLFLVFNSFRFKDIYRSQNIVVLLASLLPFVGNIVYVSGLNPVPGMDWTPIAFLVTGGLLAWSLRGFRLFDLVPIARHLLVENMGDALLVLDKDRRVVDVNFEMEHLQNCAAKTLMGQSLHDLFPESTFCEKIKLDHDARFEFVWQHALICRTYDVRSTPLISRQNHVDGCMIVMRDITWRKELEIERDRLIHELETANASKDRLFSIIAHDLRSPFNTIFSFIHLLEHNFHQYSPEKLKELLGELNLKTEQAFGLLENLLHWALTQTKGITYNPATIHIDTLIGDEIARVAERANDKGIVLKTKYTEDDLIHADGDMIAVVVRNLVGNAVKYTPKDGTITVETVREAGMFMIRISDTGVGIDPQILDHLFRIESVRSLPGTDGEKGSGLGLILCQEFVEKHGGRIEVTSAPGKGSTFTVTLPTEGTGIHVPEKS